jgi:ribosomal protein S18 acetylase RimI-like enzyme
VAPAPAIPAPTNTGAHDRGARKGSLASVAAARAMAPPHSVLDGREPACNLLSPMHLRNLNPNDCDPITAVVDDWWGGRPMRQMLQRLFFEHFNATSFVFEDAHGIRAFVIGFCSQTTPSAAYIHFVGVDPSLRQHGLARRLYQKFFTTVGGLGCTEVHCITSPVNTGSIAFHTHLGFEILPGDSTQDGVPITRDHGGPDAHRVLFRKQLP